MAPSPVVDIKPKGPDKNTEKCVDGVSLNSKQSMSKNDYGSNSKEKTTVSIRYSVLTLKFDNYAL